MVATYSPVGLKSSVVMIFSKEYSKFNESITIINYFPLSTHLINLYIDNWIAGLDFNPNGEIAATIDRYGVCLISDVNTDSYRFHLNMEMKNERGMQYFELFLIFNVFFPSTVTRYICIFIFIFLVIIS